MPRGSTSIVYVLERAVDGAMAIIGVFSSAKLAQTEVARIVNVEVGEKIQKLPGWRADNGVLFFAYGRDRHDFRFTVTLWSVDAESS
jgi:hypothetical protein